MAGGGNKRTDIFASLSALLLLIAIALLVSVLPTSLSAATTTTTRPHRTTTTTRPFDPIKDAPVVNHPGPGQVALTFDDGPSDTAPLHATSVVLDILLRERVPATFFAVCKMVRLWPMILRRASNEGHSVQNHTLNHPYLTMLSNTDVANELGACSNTLQYVAQKRPTAYRPPYGSHSLRVDLLALSLGMFRVMWNASPGGMNSSPSDIVSDVMRQAGWARARNQGVTVLLHDGSGNRYAMLAALPTIISQLRADGWQFVKIG